MRLWCFSYPKIVHSDERAGELYFPMQFSTMHAIRVKGLEKEKRCILFVFYSFSPLLFPRLYDVNY